MAAKLTLLPLQLCQQNIFFKINRSQIVSKDCLQRAPGSQVLHAKQRAQIYTTARSSWLVLSYKAVPVVLRDGPSFTSASIAYGFIFLKSCQDGIKTFLYFEF